VRPHGPARAGRVLPPRFLHRRGIVILGSWWRWISSFSDELSDQTTRRSWLSSRRSLKCGAKTLTAKYAGRRCSDLVLRHGPHDHQGGVHVTNRGPLDRFQPQHGINKVSELGGDLAARDAQRFRVPDCHRQFVVSGNVEGRRSSGQVLGINQAMGETTWIAM
jgi:hypothetical protein